MRLRSQAKWKLLAAVVAVGSPMAGMAQPVPRSANDVVMRVVDVGAGLCVVITVPGGYAMLYDAGRGAGRCMRAVTQLVPGKRFDLVVLSHSDSDHISELDEILEPDANLAAVIIHPGDLRGPLVDRVRRFLPQQKERGATIFNLTEMRASGTTLQPGRRFAVGAATATFVAGWSDGNETQGPNEPPLPDSPRVNALSIVIRFEYRGHSVLLTGDTIGREENSADNSLCQYAERIMVARAPSVPIDSDVLVGQHHGGDNSTSNCFIRAVSPEFVVFSAGNQYHHPRQSVVDRLVANDVNPAKIFRTDLGDNEGGEDREMEMVRGSLREGCADAPEDDDVEIVLPYRRTARVRVGYRTPSRGC